MLCTWFYCSILRHVWLMSLGDSLFSEGRRGGHGSGGWGDGWKETGWRRGRSYCYQDVICDRIINNNNRRMGKKRKKLQKKGRVVWDPPVCQHDGVIHPAILSWKYIKLVKADEQLFRFRDVRLLCWSFLAVPHYHVLFLEESVWIDLIVSSVCPCLYCISFKEENTFFNSLGP